MNGRQLNSKKWQEAHLGLGTDRLPSILTFNHALAYRQS